MWAFLISHPQSKRYNEKDGGRAREKARKGMRERERASEIMYVKEEEKEGKRKCSRVHAAKERGNAREREIERERER